MKQLIEANKEQESEKQNKDEDIEEEDEEIDEDQEQDEPDQDEDESPGLKKNTHLGHHEAKEKDIKTKTSKAGASKKSVKTLKSN